MATLTGKTLGKYQILERLGRGGMADVYEAYHARLDRHVAIKVLHPHLIEGQDFLARFEREAKAVASLKHPHIVQVFDFDFQEDLHYIVMELVDGGSLRGRLEDLARAGTRMPQKDALRILADVASAIDYAHGRGMLHRDVKPANVLLDHDGDACLSDFGIARILSDTQFTTTGALIGTPHYMSPEQGKGLPLTKATDLYSLGVVLYEMLTGRAPYDSETPLGVIHKHIFEPLPSPRLACPDLPVAAEDVLVKALAKEPDDRFASAGQMLQALEHALAPTDGAATARPTPPRIKLERRAAEPAAPGPSQAAPSTAPQAAAAPVQPTISSLPTMAMEDQPAPSSTPAAVSEPSGGLPPAPPKARRLRLKPILFGVAAMAVIGVALALLLPRLSLGEAPPSATSPSPVQPAHPEPCSSINTCSALAQSALEDQRYEEALELYLRAQARVPLEQRPTYAYLRCQMAEVNLALGQTDVARMNLEACIDWTGSDPSKAELRALAEDEIRAISGTPTSPPATDPYADHVAFFEPGGQANQDCADPAAALGPPDFDPNRLSTFLCLGFRGAVELEFVDNVVVDGPGADLRVYGDPEMNDTWHILVSVNGNNWLDFGSQPEVVELDLATVGRDRIRFIRFESGDTRAPELDAVEALHSEPAG
jgi:serine/threonine protein kinase